ncbi:MAG: acetate kinase [Planctomycetota bacterium]|nr:acetate kinase [Planctomycetota bacterium]
MRVLVINCGSSSLKYAVIDTAERRELLSGLAQRLGSPEASLTIKAGGEKLERALPGAEHAAAMRAAYDDLRARGLADGLAGIGHRVVHGGQLFSASVRIDEQVERGIESCVPLAPLHNPPNLLGIRICRELLPGLPQVAVFDTAFHQSMPAHAYAYAVPWAWYEQHAVRKYGFHGTSHRFVSARARELLGLRPDDHGLVVAHLGNGCSATAVRNGASVDTTMGLTPLEGLVMGTRSGDLDPAIVAFMAERLRVDAAKVVDLLNKQSGLLGVSGVSNDMRAVLAAAEDGNQRARLAIEVFCYRLAKHLAALAVPLGRVDAFVFTGGIGENSAPIRARVVAWLAVLGCRLDPARNAVHGRDSGGRITVDGATCALVVPTNEELAIALDTAALVAGKN